MDLKAHTKKLHAMKKPLNPNKFTRLDEVTENRIQNYMSEFGITNFSDGMRQIVKRGLDCFDGICHTARGK